jgi:hypothetical protein
MTTPIAAYSFLPWARQGLGIHVRESDEDAAVKLRGSIDVTLEVSGDRIGGGTATGTVARSVELYGPGDIIGLDLKSLVRTEPRHWVTNFESNYLPFVEFYDEEMPWRYTPAKPSADQRRLRPWLTLAVLKESEFKEATNVLGRPLPYIEVLDPGAALPPPEQLWAWAHVHVNGGLGVDPNDTAAVAAKLGETVSADRDLAYSRLLGPRLLEPNVAYHAFLVPSFETGRLAGLGDDPAHAAFATQSAWAEYTGKEEPTLFPFYHRWYFRTGTIGDFEYLVRLLKPRTVDGRVGRRDMDVQRPDANLPGILGLGGILRMGGALRAPLATLSEADLAEYTRFEQWGKPYPHPFQIALAALINLPDAYSLQSAQDANGASGLGPGVEADDDPLIVPPLYSRWHSETSTLVPAQGDPEQHRWVQELNLDPRHRVSAGFGTGVMQQNQESYMEAAWLQVGKVLDANQRIRYGQLAKLASQVWHARTLTAMRQVSADRMLAVSAPVQGRLMASPVTIREMIRQSTLPRAAVSTTVRQTLRPRARVSRLVGFDQTRSAGNLLARMNAGEVTAAPPKTLPPELPTEEKLADELAPASIPSFLLAWLKRYPWLRFAPIVAAFLLTLLLLAVASPALALVIGGALVAGGIWLTTRLARALWQSQAAEVLRPDSRTPASVDRLEASADFRVGTPGQTPAPTAGGPDSGDAVRFKAALRNLYSVDVGERTIPLVVRRPLDLETIATTALARLDPAKTIPLRVLAGIQIPGRIRDQLVDQFGEVMVYPRIDLPMYEPLKEISSELFLPNLQLIPNDSITLLETNQKFIESYMVGLNHEFSRELLWREYPTDQRGSYFRQFWDVRGFLADPNADPDALRERLYDIPPLHQWAVDSALGDHDNREAQGDKEEELVLVIRGELLKKYPTAVIYAHRAAWERTGSGAIDKTQPRKLQPLAPAQEANPPRDIVKTPLYEAKVDPDIYFFGFDLTAEVARGGQLVNGEEDPGWFFVIKERPGEPRFGLDAPQGAPQTVIHTWNDLAWTDVMNTYTPGGFLRIGEKTLSLSDPGAGSDAEEQYQDDRAFRWQPDTDAAELAYILYQVPVLVAVHAAEMLKQGGGA